MATLRSQQLEQLLPALRAGVRSARLRQAYADDALQQSLVALVPHMTRLLAMSEKERAAYAFIVASRTAMVIRKRVSLEDARGTDEEVEAWDRQSAQRGLTPEQLLRLQQSVERAERAVDRLGPLDQDLFAAIADEGLSEREAAQAFGMSRGNVAYRLRRAREALARAWHGTTSWARGKRSGPDGKPGEGSV